MRTPLDNKVEILKAICSRQTELIGDEYIQYVANKHNLNLDNIDDIVKVAGLSIAEVVNSIYDALK